jgi:outer membrane protein
MGRASKDRFRKLCGGKRSRRVLAAASCGAALCGAISAHAESLTDAIQLAYDTNPVLQAQRASQRQIDEEYVQAKAGYRPTVGVNASISHDENQFNQYNGVVPGITGPTITNTGQASIQVQQPLYTGGHVAAQVDAAHADILAGREALRRTEILIVQSVIGAYLDVRRDQEQLAISKDNVSTLKRQQDETNARFDVGEVTRTDVAQSDARLAQAQSQEVEAQSALAVARATYAQIVGQNPGELAPEPPISQLLPATIDDAFDSAERANPQLLQAGYAEQSSAAHLAEAKAATRPTVGLTGSFGYTGGAPAYFPGQNTNPFHDPTSDVYVAATARIPIFTGGMLASQIRAAAEADNVQRIGIETTRREILQAVAQSWNQLLGARGSLAAYEGQVKADTVAYEGVREEQQVGLRTTLDVLNAQQELENAQLALVGARHDEYIAAAAVLAAMGRLDLQDLIPTAHTYDPNANFNKVRHAIGWVPWEEGVAALDHVGAPGPEPLPPPTPPGEVVSVHPGR